MRILFCVQEQWKEKKEIGKKLSFKHKVNMLDQGNHPSSSASQLIPVESLQAGQDCNNILFISNSQHPLFRSRTSFDSGSKPLPASIPLLIHLCSESPNLSRMMEALLSACLLLAMISPGKSQVQLSNRCSSSRYCFSGDYSFTAGNGKFFQTKKHCCNTELCNNATLSLPDRNMLTENGLQCPSCFSKGEEKCESEKTINCLENETQCVDFQGVLNIALFLQHHDFTFQGCGTTDFCAIQRNERRIIRIGSFVLLVKQINCYNALRISHQLEHEG
ncbi:phospholipase A2 inhibitor and Ly6/PLAUR domain-containing protein-like [Podarcis raffonei]|uniref:phospholipase A2 inhibitor and Ly6/PLAUR domain-containing protein-like n=1 Tax=Podarcis raffonei TaxID=65483 RepID=UPI0023294CB3|nr:phospholipase A2 inhibitor and Ly6/PLAUR domain-containing protein-like [Podarcis raffonei]